MALSCGGGGLRRGVRCRDEGDRSRFLSCIRSIKGSGVGAVKRCSAGAVKRCSAAAVLGERERRECARECWLQRRHSVLCDGKEAIILCKARYFITLFFYFIFLLISLIADVDLIIAILPVVTKDLPISPRFTPYEFFIGMQVQQS